MRQLRKLAAGIAVAAAVAVVASAVPALADPPTSGGKPVVPGTVDIVSVGANTDENLFNALSGAWDKTITPKQHGAAHPYIYSWNATVPGSTSTAKVKIKQVKKGCAPITRPNGSGRSAFDRSRDESQVVDKTVHCVDFSRSSSGRSYLARPRLRAKGGRRRLRRARATDAALHWAVRDTGATKAVPASYAPKSLTLTQLKKIFSCSDHQLEGSRRRQRADQGLPPPAELRHALVLPEEDRHHRAGQSARLRLLEENQGQSKQLNSPDAIFIYSVADWVAQKYHSPLAGKKATPSQNQFGTDQVGFLGLGKIAGVSPLTTAKVPTISKAFKSTGFTRTIYDIVRYANTANHIPGYLNKVLGRTGYFCTDRDHFLRANKRNTASSRPRLAAASPDSHRPLGSENSNANVTVPPHPAGARSRVLLLSLCRPPKWDLFTLCSPLG